MAVYQPGNLKKPFASVTARNISSAPSTVTVTHVSGWLEPSAFFSDEYTWPITTAFGSPERLLVVKVRLAMPPGVPSPSASSHCQLASRAASPSNTTYEAPSLVSRWKTLGKGPFRNLKIVLNDSTLCLVKLVRASECCF